MKKITIKRSILKLINNKLMYPLTITIDEKYLLMLDKYHTHPNLEIWFYDTLELNTREYLNILANRVGLDDIDKYCNTELIKYIKNNVEFI